MLTFTKDALQNYKIKSANTTSVELFKKKEERQKSQIWFKKTSEFNDFVERIMTYSDITWTRPVPGPGVQRI